MYEFTMKKVSQYDAKNIQKSAIKKYDISINVYDADYAKENKGRIMYYSSIWAPSGNHSRNDEFHYDGYDYTDSIDKVIEKLRRSVNHANDNPKYPSYPEATWYYVEAYIGGSRNSSNSRCVLDMRFDASSDFGEVESMLRRFDREAHQDY